MTLRVVPVRDAEEVAETQAGFSIPLLQQPVWAREMPWLLQGMTWRGPVEPFDLGLFGAQAVGPTLARWNQLGETLGFASLVHSRQVHGAGIAIHGDVPAGLLILQGADGHVTRTPGLLLTVSVADCIPVYLAAPAEHAVALLHAGWRGLTGGIIAAGIGAMRQALGIQPVELRVHLGPSICGACYEVGPEVHEQLGLARPALPEPVDLVAVAVEHTVAAGVPRAAITASGLCTRCQPDRFFSHRAGSNGRQMAVLGIRRH